MLHLQKFICNSLNMLADLMTVGRAVEEGPQYEHVQVPWRRPTRCCACFSIEDILPANLTMIVDTRLSIVKGAAECGFSIDDFSNARSSRDSPQSLEFREDGLPVSRLPVSYP